MQMSTSWPVVTPADVRGAMERVFGYPGFLANQEQIISALLARRDAFAVMPTGAGKSLCYQLPACLLPGTCVVISPLISLMKDQVDALRGRGVRAEHLNSSLDTEQRARVLRALEAGHCDLLYVAPERFAMPRFRQTLDRVRICLFAIDEAHCISEWGHDFRPDYLALDGITAQLPQVPVLGVTATATLQVAQDIVRRLALRRPQTVRASFDRPNLFYEAVSSEDRDTEILSFLRQHRGESGIVYRTTRKDVEETARLLQAQGVQALPYHAGMETEMRKAHQDAFDRDEVEVIVATIAFGMGIDKPNVRFILHGDLPKNVEAYYQETGRAGRDGAPAHCLLLFGWEDTSRIRYFINKMEDRREKRIAWRKLDDMLSLARARSCRRRRLLAYFGEHYSAANCGACDICTGRRSVRPRFPAFAGREMDKRWWRRLAGGSGQDFEGAACGAARD